MQFLARVALAAAIAGSTNALQVDVNSVQSISDAAKTIAANIISIYSRNSTAPIPGLFSNPYYFWEGGLAWDSLINYWALTGDDTYNDIVSEAMLWQVGPDYDYMPPNQTKSLGNDDQSTWALAAMTAAEKGFPAPKGISSWEQLAQNVFNTQVARWDTESCGGGLRWQIYVFNVGYTYKNAWSNGNFMQLAARLAKYNPSNTTYSEWAEKVSKWSFGVGFISDQTYAVYDGASTENNCKAPNHIQWTANAGTYLSAYSYLTNVDSNAQYQTDAAKLLNSSINVFTNKDDILMETACATADNCNTDQLAFRAIFARALANAKYVDTGDSVNTDTIDSVLKASAKAAATQCSGGPSGTSCESDWTSSKYDGQTGLGQELSALEILLANIPAKGTQTSSGSNTTSTTGTASSGASTGSASPTQVATGGANTFSGSAAGLLGALAIAIVFG